MSPTLQNNLLEYTQYTDERRRRRRRKDSIVLFLDNLGEQCGVRRDFIVERLVVDPGSVAFSREANLNPDLVVLLQVQELALFIGRHRVPLDELQAISNGFRVERIRPLIVLLLHQWHSTAAAAAEPEPAPPPESPNRAPQEPG